MDITVWNVLSVWFLIGALVVLFGVSYYSGSREPGYLTDGDRFVLVVTGILVWPIAIYIIRMWYETSRSKWSRGEEDKDKAPQRTERRVVDRRVSTRRFSDSCQSNLTGVEYDGWCRKNMLRG